MGFPLDAISIAHLRGVHPDLVKVVQDCASGFTPPFTFGVSEGLRTAAKQKLEVAAGNSQTMRSRHLDGHAVDLVVLVTGKVVWAWPNYYVLADQMKAAATRCAVPVEWGGCWDLAVSAWTQPAVKESAAYILRGGHFLDGPHFQLPVSSYPSGAYTPSVG